MIAEDTMYDVRTHEIWSCAADMLPCMCGRQTLTIVVSSPCMTQAQMTVAVVKPRFGTVAAASDLMASAVSTKNQPAHAFSRSR
jgi:hypothetical protein